MTAVDNDTSSEGWTDAILERLRTEAQLARNGDHPILARSFDLAIEEIKRLHAIRASSVAPGWRLVPEQPTQAMCDAARQSWVNDQGPKVSTLWGSEAADIYRAMLKAAPKSPVNRDERQRVVVDWGARCFGLDHMRDKIVRAARFFEEAAELVQAVGLSEDHAMRAFRHVYGREPGAAEQEAGGVGVTLMALCDAIKLSADACETKEIARCLSKTPESFAARNRAKIEQVDTPTQSSGYPTEGSR